MPHAPRDCYSWVQVVDLGRAQRHSLEILLDLSGRGEHGRTVGSISFGWQS